MTELSQLGPKRSRRRKLLLPLAENQSVVELIAAVTTRTIDEVNQKLAAEHKDRGLAVRAAMDAVGAPYNAASDQLRSLYSTSDAFLYELIAWNRDPLKQDMQAWIHRYLGQAGRPLDVLCFGDGLGFDSCGFALAGHRVTYLDVGQYLVRFATEMFRQHNVEVSTCEDLAEIPNSSFDAVVCLDVLEHVEDPIGLLKLLVARVRPDGLLIANSPFHLLGSSFATHLRSNLKFAGSINNLFAPAGLTLHSGRPTQMPLVLTRPGSQPICPKAGPLRRLAIRAGAWPLRSARHWPQLWSWLAKVSRQSDQW